MDEVETWCFFTKFVCRYDDLDQAKARHQRCVDALRITNTVHFSSEDAYQAGHTEPTFRLLLTEIIPPGKEITPEKKKEYKEEYSVFVFVTIVDIPNTPDSDGDKVRIVGEKLEIDSRKDFLRDSPAEHVVSESAEPGMKLMAASTNSLCKNFAMYSRTHRILPSHGYSFIAAYVQWV